MLERAEQRREPASAPTGSAVTARGHRRGSSGSRGMVLLEVLIAVGLLGLVASCLLTGFQQIRRADGLLRQDLEQIRQLDQLRDFLTADLQQARGLLLDVADQQPSRIVRILSVSAPGGGYLPSVSEPGVGYLPGSVVTEYRWDPARETMLRAVHSQGREISRLELSPGAAVEFEPLLDSPTEERGVPGEPDTQSDGAARSVSSVRVTRSTSWMRARGSDVDREGTAEEVSFTLYLPISLPVLEPQAVTP